MFSLQIGHLLRRTDSTGSPIFLLFLLESWSPVKLVADLNSLIQGYPLFDSPSDLEPRPRHSCSLLYCFPLQSIDSSPYVCRWFIPSLVQVLNGFCVLASCYVTLAPGDFCVALSCMGETPRLQSHSYVRHNTRHRPLLHFSSCWKEVSSQGRLILKMLIEYRA